MVLLDGKWLLKLARLTVSTSAITSWALFLHVRISCRADSRIIVTWL